MKMRLLLVTTICILIGLTYSEVCPDGKYCIGNCCSIPILGKGYACCSDDQSLDLKHGGIIRGLANIGKVLVKEVVGVVKETAQVGKEAIKGIKNAFQKKLYKRQQTHSNIWRAKMDIKKEEPEESPEIEFSSEE